MRIWVLCSMGWGGGGGAAAEEGHLEKLLAVGGGVIMKGGAVSPIFCKALSVHQPPGPGERGRGGGGRADGPRVSASPWTRLAVWGQAQWRRSQGGP